MNFARESFFEESYRNRAAPNATLRHGKPGKDFPPIGASARPRKRGRELATLEHHLWHRKNLQTPGGLLIAIAVSMAPLAVYGVQDELGWWSASGNPGTVHDFY